jgi:hypothetical protein
MFTSPCCARLFRPGHAFGMTTAPLELHTNQSVCLSSGPLRRVPRATRGLARGSISLRQAAQKRAYLEETRPASNSAPAHACVTSSGKATAPRSDLPCPNTLQIVSHDRPRRRPASDLPEARTRERRGRARKNVRRAVRHISIYRIGLERCSPCALGSLQSREDQVCHDALPAVAPAHEETRDRPDRQCVYTLEPPHVVKPGYCIAWREPAPANCQVAVESEQPRRMTAADDVA